MSRPMPLGPDTREFDKPFIQAISIRQFLPHAILPEPKSWFPCAVCEAPKCWKKCSYCKAIYYCSKTCQMKDWRTHKLVCQAFAHELTRPHERHYRVLLFDTQNPKGILHWAPVTSEGFHDLRMLGTGPLTQSLYLDDRRLRYDVLILYSMRAPVSGCSRERALAKFAGRHTGSLIRGPLVVYAMVKRPEGDVDFFGRDLSRPMCEPMDVQADVLKPLKEYLALRTEYRGPIFVEQPQYAALAFVLEGFTG
ncbi:hypothetical protein BU23DRAFT_638189 [Bimuria novae-zelandiae CBS 107.79]|uniref:MYND-type domain-containing protein n=1 Tax=Bimuria novae-zelandiae CBS 107.79 TaxID=1447943 RepID=A0A6A5VAJ9_9PLEO|nr:hypothetical protein BU23DRAFT_638189 [Bimuria novae-zelandiae CBS 107.79]